MSTLKVNKIENTATTDGGIEIDNTGHVQIDGVQLPTAGPLSNRNLIINGAMQVAQRGTEETSVTATGYHTCDRMRLRLGALGTWTIQQSTDAPDGFSNSYRLLCTTADASPAASDSLAIDYRIEAQDLQHLFDTGTTTYPLTLSFWVKSSNTGNASINLLQDDNSSRHFSASYNIAAVDTWQFVTIPIPADTAAVFNNDNGIGLQVMWWLNSGSNFTGGSHQAGWGALTNTNRNATNLGLGGAVDDDFFITGIQLEVGEEATPFEHRSFGDELARCQRYFYRWDSTQDSDVVCDANVWGTSMALGNVYFPQSMRAVPDLTVSSVNDFTFSASGSNFEVTDVLRNRSTTDSMQIFIEGPTNPTPGQWTLAAGVGGMLRDDQEHPSFVEFDAEL